jgi:ribosomal protein S18 acetylase RimI-like enzyme
VIERLDDGRGEMMEVRKLSTEDVPEVVDVLCESFFDYPVMRFVVGAEAADYESRLRRLIHFFVMSGVLRNESLLGIPGPAGLRAAALVSRPGVGASPPELVPVCERVWAELGSAAQARYVAFGTACAPFEVDVPHIHLNMIGVRDEARGAGLGGQLIEHVHFMSTDDPASSGVTLTTENPENVSLYEHLGYTVVGTTSVSPDLTTWGFFRADREGKEGK